MKYEMIFGDEKLFDGTPEDCVLAVKTTDGEFIFYLENNKSKLRGSFVTMGDGVVKLAMRRIIKEPKRWTWEDKKAGRLPEVGCNVSSVAYGYVCSVVAIDSNSRHIWCQFQDQSVGSCMIFEINPIETPAEKAQREEDEWVNKAWSETAVFAGVTQDEHDRLRMHLRHIYRAQLSGELAVPKGGE
jgi:hypothetical protein